MPPRLPQGTRFLVPLTGDKKYTAVIPQPEGGVRRVSFGHRDYQHYRDQVPRSMGGGRWTERDHNDRRRRGYYRARAGGMKNKDGTPSYTVRYSPAWFAYYFLW